MNSQFLGLCCLATLLAPAFTIPAAALMPDSTPTETLTSNNNPVNRLDKNSPKPLKYLSLPPSTAFPLQSSSSQLNPTPSPGLFISTAEALKPPITQNIPITPTTPPNLNNNPQENPTPNPQATSSTSEEYYQAAPALTITNPPAFGLDNNNFYLINGYVSKIRYTQTPYANISLGFGVGDAYKSVGLELRHTLATITPQKTEIGKGEFELKIHKILPDNLAVAVGWNGFLSLGDTKFPDSLYAVATKIITLQEDVRQPFSQLTLTAGIGNGLFRSESDIIKNRETFNFFGSAALRVLEPASLIAEWTGQDLALGVSIVPFKEVPLIITPAFSDILGAGDSPRFGVVSYYLF